MTCAELKAMFDRPGALTRAEMAAAIAHGNCPECTEWVLAYIVAEVGGMEPQEVANLVARAKKEKAAAETDPEYRQVVGLDAMPAAQL